MNPGTVPDAIQEGHSPAGFTGGGYGFEAEGCRYR